MPIRRELRHFYRGPAWQAARAACRERAGDRCEQCKRKNGTSGFTNSNGRWIPLSPRQVKRLRGSDCYSRKYGLPIIRIQCGAAHVNGVAGDDRPENLKWLCRGCHLRHDRPQHKESRATRKDAARPLLTCSLLVLTAMRDADEAAERFLEEESR